MRSPKKQGSAYEAQFIADALGHGLDVIAPFGDYLPYDLLTTCDGKKFLRVQIKGTTYLQPKKMPVYKVCAGTGQNKKTKLTDQTVDIVACWVAPATTWYHVPVEHISGVSLYLAPTRKSKGKYEVWKEAWNVYQVKAQ